MKRYNNIRIMIGCVVCVMVILAAITVVLPEAQAQETQETQEGQEKKEAKEKLSGFPELKNLVKDMQSKIDKASDKLADANRPPEVIIGELAELIHIASGAKGELDEGGKLFEELKKAIQTTEAKQKEYKDKSNDPQISAKIRQRYDRLAVRFETLGEELYDRQILINRQRDDLGKHIKEWTDEKGFIADLITAGMLEDANQALIEVLDSVKAVNESFTTFAKDFTGEELEAEPAPEK